MLNLIKSTFIVFAISATSGATFYFTSNNFWPAFWLTLVFQYVVLSGVTTVLKTYYTEKTKQKELDKLEKLSALLNCAYCNETNVLTFEPDHNQKMHFECDKCNKNNSVILQFTVARVTEPLEIKSLLES